MKWNEMKWIGLYATFVHMQAKLGQENLLMIVRWVRWHCLPDTGFEIQTLEVWGRAPYLSATEAPHNTEFYEWMGKKHFCFFQTAETGKRTPNSSVKGSGADHYPRAPAKVLITSVAAFSLPSNHVGPPPTTPAQHWTNIGPMPHGYWVLVEWALNLSIGFSTTRGCGSRWRDTASSGWIKLNKLT